MSQERRITIDRTTIDDLMPFFVGISKELIAQDRVETDLQDFIDSLGTLQRDIGDFLNQLPDYLEKYKTLQEEKQAINRKIEAQKKEAAELEAKLRAEFGVGEQSSVFDTVDVLGMLSTPKDKIYHDVKGNMNALASNNNDDDDYGNQGEGNEDAYGGRIGAVDDAGRPIDPYMNMDDRLTDEMLKERQNTAVQRSADRAKAAAQKQAAAKALSAQENEQDSADDMSWDDFDISPKQNTTSQPQQPNTTQASNNLDDMFGLDDDDDDLLGEPIPQTSIDSNTDTGLSGNSSSSMIGGFGDDDLDDDDF